MDNSDGVTDRVGLLLKSLDEAGQLPTANLKDLMGYATPKSNFEATPQTYLGTGEFKVNSGNRRFTSDGMVRTREPNTAYILNPSAETIVHEGQHTQQNAAPRFSARLNAATENNRQWATPGPWMDLRMAIGKNPDAKKLMNANTFDTLREMLATFAEIEGNQREGTTIRDNKHIGPLIPQPTQKLIDTYINPLYNKYLEPDAFVPDKSAKDPLNPELSYVQQFRRWMRNKTK